MMGFRSIEDLEFSADESNYQAWKEQLKMLYHLLGFEEVEIVGDIMYPSSWDKFLGRGYNLRLEWKKGKEPE